MKSLYLLYFLVWIEKEVVIEYFVTNKWKGTEVQFLMELLKCEGCKMEPVPTCPNEIVYNNLEEISLLIHGWCLAQINGKNL